MTAKKYSVFKNTKKGHPNKESKSGEDKKIAEHLIKAIQSKIKDPDLSKKAALIIEEMIRSEKEPKK